MPKAPHKSPYLTIPQLARSLGISRIAVYKKVKKGVIPGTKIGRNFVVPATYLHTELPFQEYSSTTQIAQDLKVHRSTVYRRAKKGIIPGLKVGRGFVHKKQYVVEVRKTERDEAGFVSVPELAEQMGISRIAVYKKVKKGIIAAVKTDKGFVIQRKYARKLILRVKERARRI